MRNMRRQMRLLILTAALSGVSIQAAQLTFSNLRERGGSGTDAGGSPLSISGFISGNPGLVSGMHTTTLTVTNIDFSTGLVGGTDSFSFDLVQSTAAGSVQFRNTSGVIVSLGYEPLTISIQNIQILSGAGTVEFGEMTDVLIRTFFSDAQGSVDAYAGTDTTGSFLGSAGGSANVRVSAITGRPSITLDYELNGGPAPTAPIYANGIGFTLDVSNLVPTLKLFVIH